MNTNEVCELGHLCRVFNTLWCLQKEVKWEHLMCTSRMSHEE